MSLSIKRTLSTVGAAGLISTGLAIAAGPSANAEPWSECPASYACFWNLNSFQPVGSHWQFAGTNANWANFGRSNQDNSMVNDGNTHAVRIFDLTSYNKGGRWMCVPRSVGWAWYPAPYAPNITSSNNWYGGAGGTCIGA